MTAACVLPAIAAVLAIVMALRKEPPKPVYYIAVIFALASLVCGAAGVGLGIAFAIDKTSYAIGASSIVGIVGAVSNLIGFAAVGKVKDSQ